MTHYNTLKTHCPKGHEYTEENTYTHKGKRYCNQCSKEQRRRTRALGLPAGDKRHGTQSGYVNYGCRCDLCRAAYSSTSAPRNARAKYALSGADYEKLRARFDLSGCDLCGSKRHMQIDHCHNSGKVRGVLCARCNSGLAKFRDDPVEIRRAAAYLRGKLDESMFKEGVPH